MVSLGHNELFSLRLFTISFSLQSSDASVTHVLFSNSYRSGLWVVLRQNFKMDPLDFQGPRAPNSVQPRTLAAVPIFVELLTCIIGSPSCMWPKKFDSPFHNLGVIWIKTLSYWYTDSHYEDEIIWQLSYFIMGIPIPGKTVFTPVHILKWHPGPWFNIKMSSYRYRKSHCGNKTILRPSYLHNGISYTSKTTSLYWIGPLMVTHCACPQSL